VRSSVWCRPGMIVCVELEGGGGQAHREGRADQRDGAKAAACHRVPQTPLAAVFVA
jgi:hypothetical protein